MCPTKCLGPQASRNQSAADYAQPADHQSGAHFGPSAEAGDGPGGAFQSKHLRGSELLKRIFETSQSK
jgi:hypothetical protein